VDAIVERHLKSHMTDAVLSLDTMAQEWRANGMVPENEWGRMRSLEFQELIHYRNQVVRRLEGAACVLCADFEHHVRSCVATLL
jgi:antiviral helicase SKI2